MHDIYVASKLMVLESGMLTMRDFERKSYVNHKLKCLVLINQTYTLQSSLIKINICTYQCQHVICFTLSHTISQKNGRRWECRQQVIGWELKVCIVELTDNTRPDTLFGVTYAISVKIILPSLQELMYVTPMHVITPILVTINAFYSNYHSYHV